MTAFTCTLCWQTLLPPSAPKLLGTSSRIVCRPCWKAVLDLSICWVCGEGIVRGDEVVSLRWCFWHRECFGCLVCGVGLDVGVFEGGGVWGQWDLTEKGEGNLEGSLRRKRLLGLELESVPLCEGCEGESGERPYEEGGRGEEIIAGFDGGAMRGRERISEGDARRAGSATRLGKRRRSIFRGSSGLERELKRSMNASSKGSEFSPEAQEALLRHAADLGVSEESPDAEVTSPGKPPDESLKRQPKWMSLLPSNVNKRRRTIAGSEPSVHEMMPIERSSPLHRPSIAQRETTSYFSHGLPVPPNKLTDMYHPVNSEYIERYKPIAPKTRHERYIAKDLEPIMKRFRRERKGRQSMGAVADADAREELNRELRSLFYGD